MSKFISASINYAIKNILNLFFVYKDRGVLYRFQQALTIHPVFINCGNLDPNLPNDKYQDFLNEGIKKSNSSLTDYSFDEIIGKGAFGIVYSGTATYKGGKIPIVIKTKKD